MRYKISGAFKDYLDDVKAVKKDEDAYCEAARIERAAQKSQMTGDQVFYLRVIKICALALSFALLLASRACCGPFF